MKAARNDHEQRLKVVARVASTLRRAEAQSGTPGPTVPKPGRSTGRGRNTDHQQCERNAPKQVQAAPIRNSAERSSSRPSASIAGAPVFVTTAAVRGADASRIRPGDGFGWS